MKKRCDFCSTTSRKGLVFYKGLLGALICSDCIRTIMMLVLDNAVERVIFNEHEKE